MAVAYIYGCFLEKTANLQERAWVLRLTWPGRDASQSGNCVEGRGRVPRRRGQGIAVVKGLAVPVDSLKLQISHGCVRVSVHHNGVMRPLRWGDGLINGAGFRTGSGEGS